ncbi:conserved hypothetical protein [Pseudarthrobacter chlorophenolicus A6]|uniref:Uncharacterized protein n=1 Tax=Pseudarthrobacter chlorophenolicus (strain ATCC 700700 / DSM 12829 / CIP 107037 / JCM 12360 / KCTC 9906 / NCIMB 13794 / A6) TaxID=452863 RepID=B8HGL4_PSECP|nr:hypothetical protein [Pseudarthrobacter chlorophenolicus]ACL41280.1 conserved hypothetical protein [Pseudarthrobacter chlorophenolicus A6]SDQ67057.1 hypothetical protein SAMN04489738_2159 [Pseudarthrobacter chlorophenolicus]
MGDNGIPEQPKPSKHTSLSAVAVPFLGIAAVLVGCIVAWNQQATASFGWFAYAPLSNDAFNGSGMTFVTQGTQIGLGIAVLGLLVLAFWAGFRSGRRSGRATNR